MKKGIFKKIGLLFASMLTLVGCSFGDAELEQKVDGVTLAESTLHVELPKKSRDGGIVGGDVKDALQVRVSKLYVSFAYTGQPVDYNFVIDLGEGKTAVDSKYEAVVSFGTIEETDNFGYDTSACVGKQFYEKFALKIDINLLELSKCVGYEWMKTVTTFKIKVDAAKLNGFLTTKTNSAEVTVCFAEDAFVEYVEPVETSEDVTSEDISSEEPIEDESSEEPVEDESSVPEEETSEDVSEEPIE